MSHEIREASALARIPIPARYVTALRGIAALALAFLCLAHISATLAFRAEVFGAYALADGILCGLSVVAVIAVKPRRGSALPLLAGVAGIAAGIYLLSAPRAPLAALTLATAAWGLTVGVVALVAGYALYRSAPGPLRVVALTSGMRVRRSAATECGMLLAGAVALAFTLALLALAATGTAIPLSLVELFAAAFGYLHLRVGLTLGILALVAAESDAWSATPDDRAELEGGTA